MMFIDIISIDENKLIAKIGNTEKECVESIAIELQAKGMLGLYPILISNKKIIEQHLCNVKKAELIKFKFPDGFLPITKL